MAICGQCGRDNPAENAVCFDCGARLPDLPRPNAPRAALSGTVLGMPSPLRPPGTSDPPAEGPVTLRGAAPERERHTPTPTGGADLRRTTAGIGTPLVPRPPEGLPSESSPTEPRTAGPRREFSGTLLGHAAPAELTPRAAGVQRPAPNPASNAKTMMGVARPGIAPERAPERARGTEATARGSERLAPSPTGEAPHRRAPRGRLAALVGLGLLASLALAFLALRETAPTRSVTVRNFESRNETTDVLFVECIGCSAGARLTLGGASARLEGGKAHLDAPRLALGEHRLTFRIDDGEVHEELTTLIPVHFRVSATFRGEGTSLRGEIEVRARPGSRVEIDGKATPLEGGVAVRSFPLANEAGGESERTERIERAIPVRVTVDGRTLDASAALVGRVPPLRIVTPAPHHELVRRELNVSGRTDPHALVRAAGEETTADEKGDFSFAVSAERASTGLTLSATAPGTLTRTATVPLDRPGTPPPADARTIHGRVVEARYQAARTTLVLETQECGDPPCLVRVVHGSLLPVTPGRKVTAVGLEVPGPPATFRASRLSSP